MPRRPPGVVKKAMHPGHKTPHANSRMPACVAWRKRSIACCSGILCAAAYRRGLIRKSSSSDAKSSSSSDSGSGSGSKSKATADK